MAICLHMKHSGIDFFGFTHIPEVFSKISAGTSCDIHLAVVFVVTLRTFPFKLVIYYYLAVKSADMAVV